MTPEQIALLKAEILNDPTGRGYAGKTAQEQVDLFYAPWSMTVPGKVLTGQPFSWAAAKGIARGATTLDWPRIVARSAQRASAVLPPPGTPLDPNTAAILMAVNATESQDGDMVDPSHPEGWAAFQAGLAALQAIGDLSAKTVAAITALGTVQEPDVIIPQSPRASVVFAAFLSPPVVTADDIKQTIGG